MKSRRTAITLAILLGAFGGHQYYLGNTKEGIKYTLFFWTGIPVIRSWIDAYQFIQMSLIEFDHAYNSIPSKVSKTTEHDVDINFHEEDLFESLVISLQEEVDRFKYNREVVIRKGVSMFESFYLFETTKNFEVLRRRMEFMERALDLFTLAANSPRYEKDIDTALSIFHQQYPDKEISPQDHYILLLPNYVNLKKYFNHSIYLYFKRKERDLMKDISIANDESRKLELYKELKSLAVQCIKELKKHTLNPNERSSHITYIQGKLNMKEIEFPETKLK